MYFNMGVYKPCQQVFLHFDIKIFKDLSLQYSVPIDGFNTCYPNQGAKAHNNSLLCNLAKSLTPYFLSVKGILMTILSHNEL